MAGIPEAVRIAALWRTPHNAALRELVDTGSVAGALPALAAGLRPRKTSFWASAIATGAQW
jgi:hypothetical protein